MAILYLLPTTIVIISTSLSIRIASRALMLLNIHVSHLPVRTCELWWNGWLDLDAVWGCEWGRAWYGCIRFWWWLSKGKGQFWGWICSIPL